MKVEIKCKDEIATDDHIIIDGTDISRLVHGYSIETQWGETRRVVVDLLPELVEIGEFESEVSLIVGDRRFCVVEERATKTRERRTFDLGERIREIKAGALASIGEPLGHITPGTIEGVKIEGAD